jgi:hypothetical protein
MNADGLKKIEISLDTQRVGYFEAWNSKASRP